MKLVSFAIFALLIPALAAAQSSGIFIQAGPMTDIAWTPEYTRPPVTARLVLGAVTGSVVPNDEQFEQSQSGPSAGAALAVGVFVTPSVSLRVEASLQGAHTYTTVMTTPSINGRDETRSVAKVSDLVVAAAWHQGTNRKLGVNYLAGMVFRRTAGDVTSLTSYEELSLSIVNGRATQTVQTYRDETQFGVTAYGAGIMAGIDVVWKVSDSIAIVPQVRMVQATSELAVRPAITLRWHP